MAVGEYMKSSGWDLITALLLVLKWEPELGRRPELLITIMGGTPLQRLVGSVPLMLVQLYNCVTLRKIVDKI
jgi:hypothetical protein